jgi:hypothetical protein
MAEIGDSRTNTGRIDFGLIARSDCPAAAVNNVVTVSAIGADGKPIPNAPGTALQPRLPVMLPGQRLGLAGTLLVDRATKVSRLTATISDSQALPLSEFSTWARTVTVTDLRHTLPDASGLSTVTGTVVRSRPCESMQSGFQPDPAQQGQQDHLRVDDHEGRTDLRGALPGHH